MAQESWLFGCGSDRRPGKPIAHASPYAARERELGCKVFPHALDQTQRNQVASTSDCSEVGVLINLPFGK